jgi:tRNA pseudouridine55 synthase
VYKRQVDYIVHASKGLYVRTLSYDIGQKLGYPAHNYALHRTQAGPFSIENSYTLEELKAQKPSVIPLAEALSFLPQVVADDEMMKRVKHGMSLPLTDFPNPTVTCIIDDKQKMLAIYDKHPDKPHMKALNVFIKD